MSRARVWWLLARLWWHRRGCCYCVDTPGGFVCCGDYWRLLASFKRRDDGGTL